jgi:hypothetical protein
MSQTGTSIAAGVVLIVLFVIGLLVGLSALFAWIFWLLWQGIVVGVFGAPALSFLQAWGVWILIGLVGGAFSRIVNRSK